MISFEIKMYKYVAKQTSVVYLQIPDISSLISDKLLIR